MKTLQSYVCGQWVGGTGTGRAVRHAVTGEQIAEVNSDGIDFQACVEYGRKGGEALRAMTFNERGELLKALAGKLNEHLEEFYTLAATYGASKKDAWIDIEGGIGVLGFYSALGRKKLPATKWLVDGDAVPLSKDGGFGGQHIMVPLHGVAMQINAFNFPSWGMLEKLGPSLLAGMPAIVKSATPSSPLAHRMCEVIIESGILPEGCFQAIFGGIGDMFDHLTCQDVVSFTGSAATGQKLRSHPTIQAKGVRFNVEADSLNAIVLGEDVATDSPSFGAFIKDITRELTVKAGQKCTAIRRVIVPADKQDAVIEALKAGLAKNVVGDPAAEGVRMGPLVDSGALSSARERIDRLTEEAELVIGDPNRSQFEGASTDGGGFLEPCVLRAKDPANARAVHEIEVFGPVCTVIGYSDKADAIEQVRRGGGSLVASLYSDDDDLALELAIAISPWHGRLLVMDADAASQSTGHGNAMPQLVHGGPGRAGGGEELGGAYALHHYMQRTALQGNPERLKKLFG